MIYLLNKIINLSFADALLEYIFVHELPLPLQNNNEHNNVIEEKRAFSYFDFLSQNIEIITKKEQLVTKFALKLTYLPEDV
jgi:hypothetical protein